MARQQPTFKSEIFIPVKKDTQSFEERQRSILEDMNTRMSERRRQWETEVEQMKRDFFRLSPSDSHDIFSRPLTSMTTSSLLSGRHFDDMFGDMPKLGEVSGSSDFFGSRTSSLLDSIDGRGSLFSDPLGPGGARSGTFTTESSSGTTEGRVDADNKRFVLSFDVSKFAPEEISVRTNDQKLIVHAKHDENIDGRSTSREFSREVDIPRNVNPLALQCTLSSDNILQIEAPLALPSYDSVSPSGSLSPAASVSPSLHQQQLQQQANGKTSPTTTTVVTTGPTAMQKGSNLTHEDSSKTYKISVDIGSEYKPEDINIKTINRRLVVNARHEDKTPGRTSSREFSREFDLPDFIEPNSVTASMTEGGTLIIEAPISSHYTGSYTARPGSSKQPQLTISLN